MSFVCHDCDRKFREKCHLTVHRRIHTGEKPFACPDCDKEFSDRSSFVMHRRIHTGEKPFACPDCDKRFTQMSNLHSHRRMHTDEKPFACLDCGKKFKHSMNLNRHCRIHTGEKPFACLDCDKTFKASDKLQSHRMIHTGEKPFVCPDCDKTFKRREHLRSHHRIHTGEKTFACPGCDKTFKGSKALNNHSRIHTGEKPFACPDCDETFISRSRMIKHSRNHSGEKPFACLDCNKTFYSGKEHRKIHRDENPFHLEKEVNTLSIRQDTSLCTQSFNLEDHQKILHHGEKQFTCHVCEESFSQESLLENHVKIHPDAADFLCERNFVNFIEQSQLFRNNPHTMPVHTDVVSIVPSECELTCNASIGNCVLDVKVGGGDVRTNAEKLFDSSVSLIGNSTQKSELFHSSPDLPVPCGSNESQVICSGNCLLDVKDELVDIDMHAGNSSVSEGSLKNEDETESFKLYGCGICCQSFSTKEETMHCFNSHWLAYMYMLLRSLNQSIIARYSPDLFC